jgi:hypothetical protein
MIIETRWPSSNMFTLAVQSNSLSWASSSMLQWESRTIWLTSCCFHIHFEYPWTILLFLWAYAQHSFEWIAVSIQYPEMKSYSSLPLANTSFMFTNLFYLALVSFLLFQVNWTSWSWFLSNSNSNGFHLLPFFNDCFRPYLFQMGLWSCTTFMKPFTWNVLEHPYMFDVTSLHLCVALAIFFVWAPNI